MASEEFVVDASAALTALIRKDAVGTAVGRLLEATVCHAPHLIDAEVGNVLRRHERGGLITAGEAALGLRMVTTVVDNRYAQHGWLAEHAWELRHSISFYDGLYAALAARLDIPLLTADAKLAKSHGLPCRVELIS
ncbi:ribonuclease VapC [Nocardia neocaledoniensis NBRC 108232]|uniref:Ribonuclease VapC n=1 Tax=Nocardia neocaledoniensis TaxID=236511 RepID=A0A317NZQ0_9NOCA|nr:type II toxin-antitoxin system VapC family toxin [Nocardia neocaledoniensis]PWV79448.1 putative nucleic acid-binding protein [Nocardia neocaledoniensis]GEM33221.1 ribonuclease VapC [Nocardia neocaledoniensis NBRC 108232]